MDTRIVLDNDCEIPIVNKQGGKDSIKDRFQYKLHHCMSPPWLILHPADIDKSEETWTKYLNKCEHRKLG